MARSSAKIDVFVKLSLVLCISLLTFSMGAYVGKQMTETQFKQKQLELEYGQNMPNEKIDSVPAVADEDVAEMAEDMVKAERDIASTDTHHAADTHHTETAHDSPTAHEKPATDAEGFHKVTEDSHTSSESKKTKPHAHANHKANMDKKTPKSPTAAVKHAADRVSNSMAPAKDPKKVRKPSTVLPTVATSAIGKYTVQVASYSNEGEAQQHAAKLKDKGFPSFYVPADVQGRKWYRVSIGLFTAKKAASDYRKEILQSQAATTAIVQRIVK